MQLVNKMSAKTICGKIPNMVKARDEEGKPTEFNEPVELAKIIGVAHETVTGKTQYGDFTGFIGQFKATSVDTGEIFISTKLFLPDVVTNLLVEAMKEAGEGNAVEVAFVVGVKGANSVTGYEYTVKPLIEPKQSDVISNIEERIKANAIADKTEKPAKK